MRSQPFAAIALAVALAAVIRAAEPKPASRSFKPLPPSATRPIPDADRQSLQSGLANLSREISSLRTELKDKPGLLPLLPDVQIYETAVRYPLTYNEELDLK